ncbi:hypothetical protein DH2020_006176 [Rehmannia glutinosa]|uniref:PORR domain-containing protein n=1 Tax=Rehmannia glutinosa TaxID=99300 RepID=A0ABR0XI69_REHGL
MEPKFLISSHKASPSVCALPFFLSCNSSLLQKPKSCSNIRLSVSSEKFKRTPFLGQNLVLRENNESCAKLRTYFPVIRAGPVKRRKELPFDNVIQRDKKLKLALKIRKILMSQPDRIMALKDLEGVYSLRFKLTAEAERLYLEEMKIRNEMEDLLVVKLRKLLMMSIDKRILLEKIAHLMTDLGLPLEFRDTILSAAELAEDENRQRELDEKDLIIDRTPRFNRVKLPKGLNLSKGEMRRISQFRDFPYISPYSDFSNLRSGTLEKEKHACGVVHEILSLTVEKRTLVDHLTHFREEFRFSQQLRGMLIRHPDMFYVSQKGDRDSVFLREAYRDSQLVEKDKMLLVKEKFRALVNVPKFPRRNAPRTGSDDLELSKPTEKVNGLSEKFLLLSFQMAAQENDGRSIQNINTDQKVHLEGLPIFAFGGTVFTEEG